jgi:hypothetical protein
MEILSPPQSGYCLSRVREPQEAQKPNQHDLTNDRKAIDEEGNGTANHGCFDQI